MHCPAQRPHFPSAPPLIAAILINVNFVFSDQTALRSLLDNLLELQQLLLRKNRETCEVLGEVGTTRGSDDGGNTDDSDDDEEILSDMEEGERDDVMGAINSNMDVAINSDQSEEGTERDSTARMKRKRKRKAGGWVSTRSLKQIEGGF